MECPRDKLSACADDELTPVERTVVAGHVAHCPACRRELEDVQALIGELDRAFERDRLVTQKLQARLRRRRARWWRAAAVAAAAVVVAAIIPILLPRSAPPRPAPPLPPAAPESAIESTQGGTRTGETVTTAQGQTAQIRLKTGSAVKLFENSRLTVAPLGQTGPVASVSLGYGTARVTAPKAEGGRPAFRMSTPAGSVETIGTEFEVALAYEDGKEGHTMDRKMAKRAAKMMLLVTVFSGQVLVRHASGGEEVVRPKSGRLVGQVVGYNRDKGGLAVRVEGTSDGAEGLKGKTVEFGCKWEKNDDGKWVRDPASVKLLGSVITGDKVEIAFSIKEGYRVDTLVVVQKVPPRGRLFGQVLGREGSTLRVKVLGTGKGCEMLKGLTLIFRAEWAKVGGRWRPDPAQLRMFAKAKEGDKAEIGYYRDNHYRIRSLDVQEK